MLYIPLFVKTDTRHLVCRPTLLPAAMAHSGALSPAPFKKRNLSRKILKAKTLLVSSLNKEHECMTKNSNELKNKENCRLNFSFEQS